MPEQVSVDDTNTDDHEEENDHDKLDNPVPAKESSHHTCLLIPLNKLHKIV